ncbi:hypothetical protein U27_03448 [Candidatus Vecturithrix granuli]|uniref:Uncharacterized protein n=1 Tax=Vecturithrix granuli TaxID=1499967 RepID=A0A081BVY1_VECG1|nr:hypothetical protein U27_03448 [Candidatus Vecturithrix granuli]
MNIRKRWRRWSGLLGGILLLAVLWGCHSSSSSTQSQSCLQPGRYRYYKMTDLSLSSSALCRFPNGAQTFIEQGVTNIVASEQGYTFVAGEEGRWAFTLTCREGTKLADVSIVLDNKCPSTFTLLTDATSTAEMDAPAWGAGSIYIYEYVLLWTCGGEKTCLARESWGLIPE